VLYADKDVVERAQEGADMTCMAYIMFFKRCSEDVYSMTKRAATKRQFDRMAKTMRIVQVLAAIHQPRNVNKFKIEIVRKYFITMYSKGSSHLHIDRNLEHGLSPLGKLFIDDIIIGPIFENQNSPKYSLTTWISLGVELLTSEFKTISNADTSLQYLLHSTVDDMLLPVIEKVLEVDSLQTNNELFNEDLLHSLRQKIFPGEVFNPAQTFTFCAACGVMCRKKQCDHCFGM
jgi:hypothetical protein